MAKKPTYLTPDDLPSTTKILAALSGAVLFKLIQRQLLRAQDAQEIFDAAITALEELPQTDETAQLRKLFEQTAARVAKAASRTSRRESDKDR